jgi:hypothetical protein
VLSSQIAWNASFAIKDLCATSPPPTFRTTWLCGLADWGRTKVKAPVSFPGFGAFEIQNVVKRG